MTLRDWHTLHHTILPCNILKFINFCLIALLSISSNPSCFPRTSDPHQPPAPVSGFIKENLTLEQTTSVEYLKISEGVANRLEYHQHQGNLRLMDWEFSNLATNLADNFFLYQLRIQQGDFTFSKECFDDMTHFIDSWIKSWEMRLSSNNNC